MTRKDLQMLVREGKGCRQGDMTSTNWLGFLEGSVKERTNAN